MGSLWEVRHIMQWLRELGSLHLILLYYQNFYFLKSWFKTFCWSNEKVCLEVKFNTYLSWLSHLKKSSSSSEVEPNGRNIYLPALKNYDIQFSTLLTKSHKDFVEIWLLNLNFHLPWCRLVVLTKQLKGWLF